MILNKYQEDMLNGKYGKGKSMAMEIQLAIGESFEAKDMLAIDAAHISLSAQGADRWFAEKMAAAGAKCSVSPTVNPGYSLCYFKDSISEEAKSNMERVHNAYKKLGATLTYSCTPYLFVNTAKFGDILSFSETSVTIFANSVLGAKTNRESSFSALCASITGFTPNYGYLIDENRHGDILVNVEADLKDEFDYSMLGMMAEKIGSGIPIFRGIEKRPSTESHINLGTQLNVSGSYAMYHILGITPEARTLDEALGNNKVKREVTITDNDIIEMKKSYLPKSSEIDFVILGCPHYTYDQIMSLLDMLRENKPIVPIWVLTSQAMIALLKDLGHEKELKDYGVELVPDTCIDEKYVWGYLSDKKGLSDSPKCSYYMSSFGVDIKVVGLADCVKAAAGKEIV